MTSKTVSFISDSATPCGVEAFARKLAAQLRARHAGHQGVVALPDRLTAAGATWREIRNADVVIINLPLVAWKWRLFSPLLIMLLARMTGRDVLVILHDWSALDWRRRLVLAPCLFLASTILVCAPRVGRELKEGLLGRMITRQRGIVAVPPNLEAPSNSLETDLALRLPAARRKGQTVIGQFGSIYPKKGNTVALEVAAELRGRGIDTFVIFVGDFIKGQENVEEGFAERVRELSLEDSVFVTGYIENEADLFAALRHIDIFVYAFEQGLESNRGSVLTCLQAGKPVVVNGPRNSHEFDHHRAYREQLARGRLHLVSTRPTVPELADAVLAASAASPEGPPLDADAAWDDVLEVVEAAIGLEANDETQRPRPRDLLAKELGA